MTENDWWDSLQPKLRPFGRFVRVENPADPGTPDVYWSLPLPVVRNTSGWMELKYLDAPPVRDDTPIIVPTLTLDQVTWAEAEETVGGRSYLLLRMGKGMWMFGPTGIRILYDRMWTRKRLRNQDGLARLVEKTSEIVRCLKTGI